MMRLSAEEHGEMVFTILYNDYHRPFKKGRANRNNIEEQITIGMYRGEIPACTQDDVDMVVALVNDLITQGID
jgi:hypothetical protein